MPDQLICSGCKRVIQFRRGVAGVCCPTCNALTPTNPSSAVEMSELICSGCLTLLMYSRGAANVRCSRCNRLNSTRGSQICHLTCGQCRTTLMHPPSATTVECPTCRFVNPVRNNSMRGSAGAGCSARSAPHDARPQTVLVENPKTLDGEGKLVSNMVVGVASWKR